MAKKHQRRTHVSIRKKQEEAKKLAQRKAFYEKHRKLILTSAIALVAAIVVISLAVDFFYTPNGSMRMFMGNLMGVEETDIIRNLGTTKAPLYYKLASLQPVEGYAEDEQTFPPSDTKEQNFYLHAEDETKIIQDAYIVGVKNTSAAMLETVRTSGLYTSMTDIKYTEINGNKVSYLYVQGNPSDEDKSVFYATLVMYVDTIHDSCVLLNLSSAKVAQEELPTEEAMLAEAEGFFKNLTFATAE